MTDLTASLLAIGGAIVSGVFAYNKWQEHKTKRSVERAFSSEHDDVLMRTGVAPSSLESERQEPTFVQDRVDAALPDADLYPNPVLDQDQDQDQPASSAASLRQGETPIDIPVDELVDCIIPLALAGMVRGDKIIAPLQSLRHAGNKPVHFIGQREDGVWEAITRGGTYLNLRAGVQLANRSGALNELEYSELVMRLRQVADELDAEPDVPDMSSVMQSARALHQFVAEYDAQLSVNIISNGAPWSVSTLLAALERHGFDLRPDGRLIMPDGDGGVLFSLATNVTLADETTSRLTLLLDVPCVALARDGFGAMLACAKMLAARLDGRIVDDGGQPLSDAALDGIGGQVAAFYDDMLAADIPAGSNRALRLFS